MAYTNSRSERGEADGQAEPDRLPERRESRQEKRDAGFHLNLVLPSSLKFDVQHDATRKDEGE
jgi:hypothetical protein